MCQWACVMTGRLRARSRPRRPAAFGLVGEDRAALDDDVSTLAGALDRDRELRADVAAHGSPDLLLAHLLDRTPVDRQDLVLDLQPGTVRPLPGGTPRTNKRPSLRWPSNAPIVPGALEAHAAMTKANSKTPNSDTTLPGARSAFHAC